MLTLTELRTSFWLNHPEFQPEYRTKKRQNDYNATIRSAWVEFVDAVHRQGNISDNLAKRATL